MVLVCHTVAQNGPRSLLSVLSETHVMDELFITLNEFLFYPQILTEKQTNNKQKAN